MEQIDQRAERITDAEQAEIVVRQVFARVPDEREHGKGDGDADNLHESVEQDVGIVAAEIYAENHGSDGNNRVNCF